MQGGFVSDQVDVALVLHPGCEQEFVILGYAGASCGVVSTGCRGRSDGLSGFFRIANYRRPSLVQLEVTHLDIEGIFAGSHVLVGRRSLEMVTRSDADVGVFQAVRAVERVDLDAGIFELRHLAIFAYAHHALVGNDFHIGRTNVGYTAHDQRHFLYFIQRGRAVEGQPFLLRGGGSKGGISYIALHGYGFVGDVPAGFVNGGTVGRVGELQGGGVSAEARTRRSHFH